MLAVIEFSGVGLFAKKGNGEVTSTGRRFYHGV
jgi:hypothetical protein